ncbi:bifunctional metallophosphatase/5'-nucleotidase [Leptolyngbya sp. 15MV]|nr:bifunctional metallophosphatase/5'-nucleotidase [Leptolyngbya sp. 15MV]
MRPVFVSPGTGQPTVGPYGGAAYFKTRVDQLRSFAATYPAGPEPRGVVMISSGDNFLAGPEFNASLALPVTERFYDAVAMQLIGFDAITPGNHDFDFGPEIFARFVNGFTDGTPFVSANLDFSLTPSVQPLVASGRVRRSVVLDVGGRQVGVVGATTTLLPFIASPVTVVVVPLLPVIQEEVDALTSQGVSIIVLSSHLQNLSQEFQLVSQLRDVDAVIGGGGAELLANPGTPLVPGQTANSTPLGGTGYPRIAVDSLGRSVPVVTTFGEYRYVGRLVLGFNAAGEVVAVDPISDVVRVSGRAGDPDAVVPDPAVQSQVVDPVSVSVAQLAANVLASSEVALDGRRAIVRTRESNQGNLGADSLLWQASLLAAGSGHPIPNVALQNGGGIRNNAIIPAGSFTELNTFEINPFANFVVNVPSVSPEQFKLILENAVSRVAQEDGRFAQVAGFTMVWDASRQPLTFAAGGTQISFPGERVRSVRTAAGSTASSHQRTSTLAPASAKQRRHSGTASSPPDFTRRMGWVTFSRSPCRCSRHWPGRSWRPTSDHPGPPAGRRWRAPSG